MAFHLPTDMENQSQNYSFFLSFLNMVNSSEGWARRKEIFDLTTHTTHFIYGYMVSEIW